MVGVRRAFAQQDLSSKPTADQDGRHQLPTVRQALRVHVQHAD